MENITSGEKAVGKASGVPMVANSQASLVRGKKPTTRTSSLTLEDRLEILGDLLLTIQSEGQAVTIQTVNKNGVNGLVLYLPGVDTKDGRIIRIDTKE